MPISEDNKLSRTRKTGYKRIVKKKVSEEKNKPDMFDYNDYPIDDFFFGSETAIRKKIIESNIKIN